MKNTIKKSAIIVAGIFAIALVSGSTLLAQERNSGGLIIDADVAFVTEESNGTVTPNAAPEAASSNDVISATDLAFVSQPFADAAGDRKSVNSEESTGVITVADYRFVAGTSVTADCDAFGNALACVQN